jgi:hypothetical protein
MAGDVVDRDAVFENTQVHYNPSQRWYYLPHQTPSELLIFKNADSEAQSGASPGVYMHFIQCSFSFVSFSLTLHHILGVPHASFDNPHTTSSDFRRESVEFRVLVLW